MNAREKEEALTLEILQTIEQQEDVTQRHLADNLGVALGLANSYLKRCVRKGLVKIHQAPANRYLYYLTPKGFSEKSRLTAEYLSSSFDMYRKAGDSYRQKFQIAQEASWQKLLFCGISEFAEIASLRVDEFGLEHIATYEQDSNLKIFLGKPVLPIIESLDEYDACVITTFKSPSTIYKQLSKVTQTEKILVPDILDLKV